MKRTIAILLTLMASTLTAKSSNCPSINSVEKQIAGIFKKKIHVKAVYPIGIEGFCRVITVEAGNFFIDTQERYLIQGLIFKLPDRKVDKKFLKFLERSVDFRVGKGKEYIYVIVDPNCEACRNSSEKIKEFIKHGIQLRFIVAPFSGKDAEEKAYRLVCNNGGIRMFMSGKYTGKVCSEGKLKVWSVMDKLKARGLVDTPIFILPNGKIYLGTKNLNKVIEEFSEK
ncbi:disulfide isomerase DsbC N-terminal domain-containing protein [Desulfurobacterium indicum]|uniref:Uncharacterized protein n=1 Tax=Desulfurobacterium indicum TaxID=1914305 RepID=A0A1R1MKZ1_9BACT|nr:disulfide isomerase DsbC N-terminal domain-containing protein [Desulfurobacterium indicum]OMH40475.1 hypothetical protein BLW93_04885 [Desulfurobacterium indicum]